MQKASRTPLDSCEETILNELGGRPVGDALCEKAARLAPAQNQFDNIRVSLERERQTDRYLWEWEHSREKSQYIFRTVGFYFSKEKAFYFSIVWYRACHNEWQRSVPHSTSYRYL